MSDAPHPLIEIDRNTITEILDALNQEADHARIKWNGGTDTAALGTALSTMQDLLTRAVDVHATIVRAETPNDNVPMSPEDHADLVNAVANAIGEAFNAEIGKPRPDWMMSVADEIVGDQNMSLPELFRLIELWSSIESRPAGEDQRVRAAVTRICKVLGNHAWDVLGNHAWDD